MLSGDTRAMDPAKAASALDWVKPTTSTQIEAFLGFVNYLRDYIPLCAELLCAPLDALQHVKGTFTLDPVQTGGFDTLVATINRSPVLSELNPELELNMAVDTSQFGIGAVLYQEEKNKIKYIAFTSKALIAGQKNYPATKRELLGIIVALQKFHVHLYGRKFNLFTDHKALLAISTKEELSYVMANWLDVLSQYDFDLYHRPGVLMVLPDRISRMYVSLRRHRTELDAIETTATDSKVRRIKLDELT
jgi:hypothetical protein